MERPDNLKVGDKFRIIRALGSDIDKGFNTGDIVQLIEDGGCTFPWFCLEKHFEEVMASGETYSTNKTRPFFFNQLEPVVGSSTYKSILGDYRALLEPTYNYDWFTQEYQKHINDTIAHMATITYTGLASLEKQSPGGKRKGVMAYLRKLTNTIKNHFSKEVQALYQLGWAEMEDDDLTVTEEGQNIFLDFLALEHPEISKAFGEYASKRVAQLKKEENK